MFFVFPVFSKEHYFYNKKKKNCFYCFFTIKRTYCSLCFLFLLFMFPWLLFVLPHLCHPLKPFPTRNEDELIDLDVVISCILFFIFLDFDSFPRSDFVFHCCCCCYYYYYYFRRSTMFLWVCR